jgi:hypothetical protein
MRLPLLCTFETAILLPNNAELRHLRRQTTRNRHPEHLNTMDFAGNRSAIIISMSIVWWLGAMVGVSLLLSILEAPHAGRRRS